MKRHGDAGAMHIAFKIDGDYAVAKHLKLKKVDAPEGPNPIPGGPIDNLAWLYPLSTWGQFL